MRNIIYVLIILIFCSCKKDRTVKFEVTNHSGTTIDSVIISGLGKTKIQSLKKSQSLSTNIDYSQSETRIDGSYQIKIFENGKSRDYYFGYYTNGLPISDYDITIESDTITLKEKLHHE